MKSKTERGGDRTPVPQPPCIDCGENWSMSRDEEDFWYGLCATAGYQFPKRCPSCRKKKREMRNSAFSPDGVPARLVELANKIEFGEFDEQRLSRELREIAASIRMFLRKGSKKNESEEETKAVA